MPLREWSNLRNYVERRVLLLRIIAKRESRTALAHPRKHAALALPWRRALFFSRDGQGSGAVPESRHDRSA